ncbi:hypothetical protein B0O99DRAFT_725637 [Bisporella sp. PMI_857]|nr:hypothetical protein B0O99DRAFT_725637 [Bisporella sp. PMI_857]
MEPGRVSPTVDTSENAFEAARDRFLKSLCPADRLLYSPCASAEDFIKGIQKLQLVAERTAKSSRKFKFIHSLAKQLQPYFEVVNILVSSNPKFSAVFWGAFRLVLELSKNLVTFFDRLMELLAQLLSVFPRYEDVTRLCNDENSERIRQNIEEVYVDMLEIFQAAVKVFTRASGSLANTSEELKRTPLVLGSLLWQPLDVKYNELLDKMAIHKHNISEEVTSGSLKPRKTNETRRRNGGSISEKNARIQLVAEERRFMGIDGARSADSRQKISALLSQVQEERENLEHERLKNTVTRVQEWLRPSSVIHTREMKSKIMDDIHLPPNRNSRKFGSNMLWICGHPGSGKTVLATSILDELDQREDCFEEATTSVLYHFFEFDSMITRSPEASFRSMLSQFLWQHREDKNVVDKFAFMMTTRSQGQSDASESALVDLLKICLDDKVVILLDGVDECKDSDSLLATLLGLSLSCNHRTLVLSRIDAPRLQRQSGHTTLKLATTTFTWLSHRATPMTTYQTRQAFVIDGTWSSENKAEDITEFENAVIMACRGLVEMVPVSEAESASRVLKFIHLTVREILAQSDAAEMWQSMLGGDKMVNIPQSEVANLSLARSCLRQLMYHTPASPLSGMFHKSISALQLESSYPFTDYAALHWMHHLGASIPQSSVLSWHVSVTFEAAFNSLTTDLQTFLESPRTVTTWLEAYYTASYTTSPSGQAVRRWASWVSEQVQKSILRVNGALLGLAFEFRSDLDRIVRVWNTNLRMTPHILWDEVTAQWLVPSQLFFSSGSTRVKSRAPERLEIYGLSKYPYTSKSAVSTDGSLLSVFSIWPDKDSLASWEYQNSTSSIGIYGQHHYVPKPDNRRKIGNWAAEYEVWPLDLDRPRLAVVVVELDEEATTLIQSSKQPLSISPDCLSFSTSYRIWRLRPRSSSIANGLSVSEWPAPVVYETIKIKTMTFDGGMKDSADLKATFSLTAKYILLTERFRKWEEGLLQITDCTKLSAFEIEASPGMKVTQLISPDLDFETGRRITQIVVHPTRPLCVLLAMVASDQPSLYLWRFQTDLLKTTTSDIAENPGCKSLAQSGLQSCVPGKQLSLHAFGPGRMIRGFSATVDPLNAVAVKSTISGEGVRLHVSQENSLEETVVHLAAIPNLAGVSNSTAEVKLPYSGNDSAKIIVHKADATGHGDAQLPMVIERDSRFFCLSQDIQPKLPFFDNLDSNSSHDLEMKYGKYDDEAD